MDSRVKVVQYKVQLETNSRSIDLLRALGESIIFSKVKRWDVLPLVSRYILSSDSVVHCGF